MNETILVIDDEPRIVKQARDYLEKGGFRVVTAGDGRTALAVARHERPDARVEETDRLIGLELGADDYITKPFSPRELVARVRAVLRRVRGGVHQPGLIRAGDLEIDLHGHRVVCAGESIHLTRSEFNLLAVLAQHPGQTFTREQLLDRLHGVAYDGFDRSIDAHVKNLRQKLEPNPGEPRYVLTVYGIGYKFTNEV
jgi:two-component system alkaline phosphatase synthesis response regulator PhoP